MHEFDKALADYAAGHLSSDGLLAAAEKFTQGAPSECDNALHAIEHAYSTGMLPGTLYQALNAKLDDTTRMAPTAHPELPLTDSSSASPTKLATLTSNMNPSSPADAQTIMTSATLPDALQNVTKHQPTSRSTLPTEDLKVGDVIKERFVLKQVLGVGGMGTVFKALDLRKVEADDKEPFVAIKVLNADFRNNPMALIALQRETKRAQTLSHPNIINVYDFDRDGQHVFMSMEFLSGHPLSQTIRNIPDQGAKLAQIWPIADAIARALGHAHRKGIVHSDLKPGNVFLDDDGELKVLDFGIACAVSRHDQPQDATIFNARELGAYTPAYASYEQLLGEPPDPRDDIYALGCVTYELLTGKHPFGKLPADKALELNLQPKPIPGLGRRQWKGLQRAMALKKTGRTPTIDEFISDLSPRSPWFYGLVAASVLVIGLIGGNVYLGMRQPLTPVKPPIMLELDAQQKQKIADLLELAQTHFDVGFYTAPTGSNALWAYQEVLKIDPYNESAINGIRKIADTLEQEAWEAFEKGDRTGSMKKVMEGLEANPQHNGLLQLKAKLRG